MKIKAIQIKQNATDFFRQFQTLLKKNILKQKLNIQEVEKKFLKFWFQNLTGRFMQQRKEMHVQHGNYMNDRLQIRFQRVLL